jgi:hypothetical protein
MKCLVCYFETIETSNIKTKSRKYLVKGKWNNFSKKSYGCKSCCFKQKKLEEEVDNSSKGSVEGQSINKCASIYGPLISNFFVVKNSYKQGNIEQQ